VGGWVRALPSLLKTSGSVSEHKAHAPSVSSLVEHPFLHHLLNYFFPFKLNLIDSENVPRLQNKHLKN
jgi:hypothetical protein